MIRSKLLVSMTCGALLALTGFAGTAGAQEDTTTTAVAPSTTIDCTYGGEGCPTTPPTTPTTPPTTPPAGQVPTYTVVQGATTSITPKVDCPVGSQLVLSYDGASLGSFVVNADGTVGPVAIPAKNKPGTYAVTGICDGVDAGTIANVVVQAANVTPATPPKVNRGVLARTGLDNTGPLVGIGLAVIVLGGAFVYGSRKPRTSA